METYEREVDAFWEHEAEKAHAERVASVKRRLSETGGKLEPWMMFAVGPLDLKAALDALTPTGRE